MADVKDLDQIEDIKNAILKGVPDISARRINNHLERITGAVNLSKEQQADLLKKVLYLKRLALLSSSDVIQLAGYSPVAHHNFLRDLPFEAKEIEKQINNKYNSVLRKTAKKSGVGVDSVRNRIENQDKQDSSVHTPPVATMETRHMSAHDDKPEPVQMLEQPDEGASVELPPADDENAGVQDDEALAALLKENTDEADAKAEAEAEEPNAEEATADVPPMPEVTEQDGGDNEDNAGDDQAGEASDNDLAIPLQDPFAGLLEQMECIVDGVHDQGHPLSDTDLGQEIRQVNREEGVLLLKRAVKAASANPDVVPVIVSMLESKNEQDAEEAARKADIGHTLMVGLAAATDEGGNNPLPYIRAILRKNGIELHSQITLDELMAEIDKQVKEHDALAAQPQTKSALEIAEAVEQNAPDINPADSRKDQLEALAAAIYKATGAQGPLVLKGHERMTSVPDLEEIILKKIAKAQEEIAAGRLDGQLKGEYALILAQGGPEAQLAFLKSLSEDEDDTRLQELAAMPISEFVTTEPVSEVELDDQAEGTAPEAVADEPPAVDEEASAEAAADAEENTETEAPEAPAMQEELDESAQESEVQKTEQHDQNAEQEENSDPTGMNVYLARARTELVEAKSGNKKEAKELFAHMAHADRLTKQADDLGQFENALERDVFRNLILSDLLKNGQKIDDKLIKHYRDEARDEISRGRADAISAELKGQIKEKRDLIANAPDSKRAKKEKITATTKLTKDNYKQVLAKRNGISIFGPFAKAAMPASPTQLVLMGMGAAAGGIFAVGTLTTAAFLAAPFAVIGGVLAGAMLGKTLGSIIDTAQTKGMGEAMKQAGMVGAIAVTTLLLGGSSLLGMVAAPVIGFVFALLSHNTKQGKALNAAFDEQLRKELTEAGIEEKRIERIVRQERGSRFFKTLVEKTLVSAAFATVFSNIEALDAPQDGLVAQASGAEQTASDNISDAGNGDSNSVPVSVNSEAAMGTDTASSSNQHQTEINLSTSSAPAQDGIVDDVQEPDMPNESMASYQSDSVSEPAPNAVSHDVPLRDQAANAYNEGNYQAALEHLDNDGSVPAQIDAAVIRWAHIEGYSQGDALTELADLKIQAEEAGHELTAEYAERMIAHVETGQSLAPMQNEPVASMPAQPAVEQSQPSAQESFNSASNDAEAPVVRNDMSVDEALVTLRQAVEADGALPEHIEQSLIRSLDNAYAVAMNAGDFEAANRAMQAAGEVYAGEYESALNHLTAPTETEMAAQDVSHSQVKKHTGFSK